MAENNSKDLISNEVLQKATQDILQTVAEHLYDYEPYTNEQIAEIFDLDNVTVKSLSKVINDEYVAKNKVFSNEHTMELLSKTLAEANQYTTEQIANSGKLERKIVTSTSEVINENILYLILTDSTNNIYTQYMLIDGNATPLGTTQINLNDYLKTIDFNTEIDKYAKKNTVVLQNDVVGNLTTLSSNQVLNTQGVSDELDKKVDKSSIVTSIDSSSTDSELPTAKSVWDSLYELRDPQVLVDANKPTSRICEADLTTINTPAKEGATSAESSLIISIEGRDYWNGQISISMAEPEVYVRSVRDTGTWTKWKKLCDTSVKDIPVTNIDLTGNSNVSQGDITYMVRNGICYVSILNAKFGGTPVTSAIPEGTFPKPVMAQWQALNGVNDCTKNILVSVNTRGGLSYHLNSDSNMAYDGSFSYPVAEQ